MEANEGWTETERTRRFGDGTRKLFFCRAEVFAQGMRMFTFQFVWLEYLPSRSA